MDAHFPIIRSSSENRTCCCLHHFLTMDSDMPYSWVISRLLLTATASTTIFNLKLRSEERWRVLGIFAIEQEVDVYDENVSISFATEF